MRSNLDNSVGGRLTFSTTDILVLYFDCLGFAAARIAVRAFRVQIIPALATDTVCYSIAS
jgi:hypothetical protein